MTRYDWVLLFGLLRPGVAGEPPQRVLRDIEYARPGGVLLLLDLYLPERASGKLPVILSVHGGGWHSGSKEASPGTHFTRYGYAVAAINYRLIGQGVFPAQIEDCKAAVRWLRAHAAEYDLDAAHIGAWGASAGGHLVALLGSSGGVRELEGDLGNPRQSSRVQAVVDYFGPTDLARWRPSPDPAVNVKLSESRLIGADVTTHPAQAARANPITYVRPGAPPFFIGHGAADSLVPVSQSKLLYDALERAGVPAVLRIVPGAGHSVHALALDEAVRAFLDRYLKPPTGRVAP
jgi:acetyl esterase/lipase